MYEMIQEGVSQRPSTSLSLFLMMGEIVLFITENLFYANIGRSAKMHWKEEFCVNLAIVIIFIGQMSSVERKKREKSFFHNKKLTASPCGPLCSTEGNEITWYPFHQQRFVYSLHFYFCQLYMPICVLAEDNIIIFQMINLFGILGPNKLSSQKGDSKQQKDY